MRSTKTIPHTPSQERLCPAERVTRQIKAALERDVRPWVKPWSDTGASPLMLPRRANGIPYRGINTLALWPSAQERGFASSYWFTFKQALAAGAAVRKRERGSFIVFYTELPGDADTPNPDDAKGDKKCIVRGQTVVKAMQIDGLPAEYFPEATPPMPLDEDNARLTAMFAKLPMTVRHSGDRACYAIGPDVVQMPVKSALPM